MKALVFDFDGTLADSLPLYVDILYRGRTSSHSDMTYEQMTRLRQAPLLRLVGHLDVPPFSRIRLLWHRWRHLHRRMGEANAFGNLKQVLAKLHKEGHPLFVLSSNYERNVRAFLRAKKMEQYFTGVYHTNVFRKASGLRKLMRQENLTQRDTYYIANEPLDMKAASKAGAHSVAVLWSGHTKETLAAERPSSFAKKPDDLLKLFSKD